MFLLLRHLPGMVLAGCALIALPASAQSAAAATPPPGLRQGFDAAWARQPEALAAAQRRDAVAARLAAARGHTPEPASLSLGARTDRATGNQGRSEQEVGIAVPLWLPGERAGLQAAASADGSAIDARLDAARWRLAGEVRETFWAHQRALLDEDLAARRLASARALAADVARRLRAGDVARSDANLTDSAAAAATGAAAEALAARLQTGQRWAAVTGLPPPPAALPGASEPDPAPTAAPTESHPALRDLQARVAAALRQRELAQVQRRASPEVSLAAIRERDGFGSARERSLALGLRIPLGTASGHGARVATAGADLAEAEAQLAIDTDRLRLEAATGADRAAAALAVQAAALERARLAAETLGFFERSFRAGETDLPTRLRIALESTEAARLAARSRLDRAAAVSQWRHALGLLPD